MDAFVFPATLQHDPESGETIVEFRDVPGAATSAPVTDGDVGALHAEARDCLEEAVAARIADGDALPEASSPRPGEVTVPLPLRMAAKLALHRVCRAHGMGPSELARRLGCDLREAQRLLDTKHQSKVDRLADAVSAVGGPILVLGTVEPADAATWERAAFAAK